MVFVQQAYVAAIEQWVCLTDEEPQKHRRQTNPPSIRTWLTSLAVLLNVALWALVTLTATLLYFSIKRGGFTALSINHYVLVYAPTAVLVWVVALARQVDYRIKMDAPWHELLTGRTTGTQSLGLDYVSAFQATAFFQAIRNRHVQVALSITTFFLLKLATLISTGLLVVAETSISSTWNIPFTSGFIEEYTISSTNLALIDRSLAYTTFGVLSQGIRKPFGLGSNMAYAKFQLPDGLPDTAEFLASVQAFVPSMECRPANVSVTPAPPNSTDSFPNAIIAFTSDDCDMGARNASLYTLNPSIYVSPLRQLSGVVRSTACSNSTFNAKTGIDMLFVLADMRYEQTLNETDSTARLGDRIRALSWQTSVKSYSSLVCRMSFFNQHVSISASARNLEDSIAVISVPYGEQVARDDNDSLGRLFSAALSPSDQMFGSRAIEGYSLEYPDPMFKMMALVSDGTYESLLDSTVMRRTATNVSTQLAAQMAHRYLRVENGSRIELQARTTASRLHITVFSATGLVVALIAAGICGTVSLRLSGQKEASITVLQNNIFAQTSNLRQFERLVAEFQVADEKTQASGLGNLGLSVSHKQDTTVVCCQQLLCKLTKRGRQGSAWWHPVTVRPFVLTLTFAATALAIISLEILQRLSDANNGFMALEKAPNERTLLLLRTGPVAFVFLLAALYNCLDFNIILLAPFRRMRSGLPLSELRRGSEVGDIPILALWRSIRRGHMGCSASTSAALVGSSLAIVFSGMYTIRSQSTAKDLTLTESNSISPSWPDSARDDKGAALISSLIENHALNYPDGTFAELVFPIHEVDTSSKSASAVHATFPVLRADLDCTSLLDTQFNVTTTSSRIQNTAVVSASFDLPAACRQGGSNGTGSALAFMQTFFFPTNVNQTAVGKLLDLHVGPYDPINGGSQGELYPTDNPNNPLGCPSLAFVYGTVDLSLSEDTRKDRIAVKVCFQKIQQLTANLTFNDHNLRVNTSLPPLVDESNAQYLVFDNETTTLTKLRAESTAFQFRPQGHFDLAFALFNTSVDNPFDGLSGSAQVDNFFQGVLFGQTPTAVRHLALQSPEDEAVVFSGILGLYRRYMAQAISMNMRVAVGDPRALSTSSSSASAPSALTSWHVVQDKTSKIILQCMLGYMLLAGAVAVYTVPMRRLLPASGNPCTILGSMVLFAGSSLRPGHAKVLLHSEHAVKLDSWMLPGGRHWYGIDAKNE